MTKLVMRVDLCIPEIFHVSNIEGALDNPMEVFAQNEALSDEYDIIETTKLADSDNIRDAVKVEAAFSGYPLPEKFVIMAVSHAGDPEVFEIFRQLEEILKSA